MDNNALPEILKEIMASPQFEQVMASIRPTVEETPKAEPASAVPSIPPEVLAKLPDVISALTGGTGDTEKIVDKLPDLMNVLSSANAKNSDRQKPNKPTVLGGDARRKALLRALRPYMNSERQAVIDNVIRFESMAEIMSSLMDASDFTKGKGE